MDTYHGKHKKKVFVSPYADTSDLIPNIETAMVIVDNLGIDVKIRAHIDPAVIKNHKNPEYEINGRIGDGTHRTGNIKNFVANSFDKLKEGGQLHGLKETFIVMDFSKIENISNKDYKAIVKSTFYKLKYHYTVKELYFVYNNKAILIERKEIPNDERKGYDYIFDKLYSIYKETKKE